MFLEFIIGMVILLTACIWTLNMWSTKPETKYWPQKY